MVTNPTRTVFGVRLGFLALGGALALAACSSGAGPATSGSGGKSPGTGGSASTGGTSGGSGGGQGTGGSGSGGTTSSGGASGTGGSSSGGATGTGGSNSGGVTGSGGAEGGASSGGATGTGGAAEGGRGGNATSSGGHGGGSGTGGGGGATTCAGHAISFSANVAGGSDSAQARVDVPFSGSADLPIGNAQRTVEFWAYVLSSSWSADTNTMFFYGDNARNSSGFGLDFGKSANGIGTIDPFTNNDATDPTGDNQPSGVMSNKDQWVHFAMTWDGSKVHGYVNGVDKVAVPISTMLHTTMADLIIGAYPKNAYFNGYIDEFRVWNVARTAAEITSTMNHTLVGNEPGLTGYWKFDETSGTTAADSVTSSGHTAHPGMLAASSTANNPTWVVSTAPLTCP